jgi:hypothetical protein
MKKYLPSRERELTSFQPRSSKSLCSVDGTYTTPHASVGTEMFQGIYLFIIIIFSLKHFIPIEALA